MKHKLKAPKAYTAHQAFILRSFFAALGDVYMSIQSGDMMKLIFALGCLAPGV